MESRSTFYFDVHGEVNTDKTIELARERADELGVGKVAVASETGLSALKGSMNVSGLTREVATERGSASRFTARKRVLGLLEEGVIEKGEGFDYRLVE